MRIEWASVAWQLVYGVTIIVQNFGEKYGPNNTPGPSNAAARLSLNAVWSYDICPFFKKKHLFVFEAHKHIISNTQYNLVLVIIMSYIT